MTKCWANAFVEGRRYDMLKTNPMESTNGLLKDIRKLPITKLVEGIHVKLMKFFEKRQIKSESCTTRLSPWAETFLAISIFNSYHVFRWLTRLPPCMRRKNPFRTLMFPLLYISRCMNDVFICHSPHITETPLLTKIIWIKASTFNGRKCKETWNASKSHNRHVHVFLIQMYYINEFLRCYLKLCCTRRRSRPGRCLQKPWLPPLWSFF